MLTYEPEIRMDSTTVRERLEGRRRWSLYCADWQQAIERTRKTGRTGPENKDEEEENEGKVRDATIGGEERESLRSTTVAVLTRSRG
jgi:hypothetical protein